MTEQETIEQAIIGKRVVAVSWRPMSRFDSISLESITLEDGGVLLIWAKDGIFVNIEETNHANT